MPWRVWVVVIGVLVGCWREEPIIQFDTDLQLQISLRLKEAGTSLKVSAGVVVLRDGIGSDPAVMLRGAALFGALSADPKIVEPVAATLNQLGTHPDIQAAVVQLQGEHPQATLEQIGDIIGQRAENNWSTEAVQRAWMSAFGAFLKKLRARPELTPMEVALDNLRIPSIGRERMERWSARLVELAGGKRPDRARARELYIRHAWSEERMAQLVATLAANPVVRGQTAKAFAEMLGLESVQADLHAAVTSLVSDRVLLDRIFATVVPLSMAPPPIERVRTTLNDLMTSPALIDTSARLAAKVISNPEVRAIAARWYEQLRTDPSVRAEFTKFLDGW